jgi:hypothetical protein
MADLLAAFEITLAEGLRLSFSRGRVLARVADSSGQRLPGSPDVPVHLFGEQGALSKIFVV